MSPRGPRRPRNSAARQAALDEAAAATAADPLDGLRLAVGTLTALPIRPPSSIEPPVPGRAMLLAPAVALVPGTAAWLTAGVAGWLGLGPLVSAVAAIGVLALTTRGLHLDGLADTADGLASSYRRERALEVMRSGDTGPAGLATVVLVLFLQVTALAQALDPLGLGAGGLGSFRVATSGGLFFGASPSNSFQAAAVILIAAVAGRVCVPLACLAGIPSARAEGLGATVAGSVSRAWLAVCVAAAVAACTLIAWLAGWPLLTGVLSVALGLLAAAVLLRRATRRLGGITGDVIGACVEIGTAAALVAIAIGAQHLGLG